MSYHNVCEMAQHTDNSGDRWNTPTPEHTCRSTKSCHANHTSPADEHIEGDLHLGHPSDPEACGGGSGRLSRLPSDTFDDSARSDGSAGRVQPAKLEWQQLSCAYRVGGSRVLVLQDVWGQALPGEMQVRAHAIYLERRRVRAASALLGSLIQFQMLWRFCRRLCGGCGTSASSRATHCLMYVHAHLEMQALLGPSGAGKSTLMDILAQRKSMGQLSGFLLVNGRPATSSFIRKTAYVPQVSGEEQRRASMASAPCSALTAYTHMHAHAYNRRPSPILYVPF